MECTLCHLYHFILPEGRNSIIIKQKKMKKKIYVEQVPKPGIDPGPLVEESDAITTRLRGQIVRRPN